MKILLNSKLVFLEDFRIKEIALRYVFQSLNKPQAYNVLKRYLH